MSLGVWVAVALAGGAGAAARFVVDTVVERGPTGPFPLGTLTVNVSGSFALGLLTGLHVTGAGLAIAGGGAIGAYTTFSTWMLETAWLGEDGRPELAALNVAVSLVAGLGAAGAGWALGGAF
jgi:CrcB protein